ncbi:MAG: hypothetical protein HUJ76_10715, partial [Parasporobacterium sp.]|nr:hypothetical protein [Parasporobacterium sp.]
MSKQDYFGDWMKVIPEKELDAVMIKVARVRNDICPNFRDIFKAFKECPYNKLKLIILGQDPYPQEGVATGIAFANENTVQELSPSLNIIKESVIDLNIPHNLITFAPDLLSWEKQGVLLLNSALTCIKNQYIQ